MTNVTFVTNFGYIVGFEISGHAEFNKQGPDILCSAISMASQMTANGLEELTSTAISSVTKDGFLSVSVHEGYEDEKVQVLFNSFKLAAINLAEQYPKFINFQCFEL